MPHRSALERVVVTGMGAVAANGQSVAEFWANVRDGRTGLTKPEGIGPEHLRDTISVPLIGQIRGFDHRARLAHLRRDKVLPHAERYSWLAAAAADEAVRQSGLELPTARPERVAVIIGSATGGQATVETASRDHYFRQMKATHPLVLIRLIPSSAAAHVGIEYGAKGPVLALSSACASADHAIAVGQQYIRHGIVDIAIVGGTEAAITYGILVAMQSCGGLLTKDCCRPFDARRSGTVLSEGAGILVLESESHARARGASALAVLAGVGMTASAEDIDTVSPGAVAHAMTDAICGAGIAPGDIDYLNAFGLGTRASDAVEADAIHATFGTAAGRLAISATKPVHGYAFGATGALEAIACIKAIEEGFVPPTIGLERADPAISLGITACEGRRRPIRHAMTTTLALGGMATALVFAAPPA